MKKLLLLIASCFATTLALAQETRFEYNAYYEYYFENREFDYPAPGPMSSGTINGVSLTPSIGLGIKQSEDIYHRLSLGVDIRRNMGGSKARYLDEVTIFYDGHVRLPDGARFEGSIGVFPRHFCEGEYGRAFFSDSLRFVDRNLEGVLLKYKTDKFYAELGADWMGRKEDFVKERFMIFSAGSYSLSRHLSLGWAGTFYHYAGSVAAPGVVDNNLLNPYIKIGLIERSARKYLRLKVGLLGTYQWDREREPKAGIKLGTEVVLTGKCRSLSFENSFFSGSNFQYLYSNKDLGGNKYGNMLYFGSPFYGLGIYNMAEFAWTPRLGRSLYFSLKARFHFSQDGFLGNSQMLGFIFNFDRTRHPHHGEGRVD